MFFRKLFTIIFLIFLITLTACQGDFSIEANSALDELGIFDYSLSEYKEWTEFNDGNAFLKEFLIEDDFQSSVKITVVKLKQDSYDFNILEEVDAAKSIAYWQDENNDLDLIINGAFFDENNKATGGMIINGEGSIISEKGSTVYEGAVIINDSGELEIRYLPSSALKEKDKYNDVLVSFPYLIKNGKNYLKEAGEQKAARTLIGSDNEYIYFISCPYFTFYEAMLWAEENVPDLKQLLNLDGGSSTALSFKIDDENIYLINSLGLVPSVITAKKK